MNMITHIPSLQVLFPFFGALLCGISFNNFFAWLIATITIAGSIIVSIQGIDFITTPNSYAFGNWQPPIGIEYKLDFLNQPIIIFINCILFLFLLFGKELIKYTITEYIDKKRRNFFYSIILFAHAGYIGVLSTNDLFNLYVFIEISSLATYVLMSQGKNPRALIGAFDYLVLGTIGATLMLIGIGFLLAITGSLNITDVASILKSGTLSRTTITAIVFFLTGAILKMAFFPMHFWMIRAYSSAPSYILTYLAAISSLMGVYIILRFMHFSIDASLVKEIISSILRPVSIFTILICTFLALKSENIKKLVIYSTASQIGYIFLLMSVRSSYDVLFQLLFLDSINKVALFTIITHLEIETDDLTFDNFKHIKNSFWFKILTVFAILFSSGLPMTSMFLVKINFYDLLISQSLIIELTAALIGGGVGLLYHFKLVNAVFFNNSHHGTIKIDSNLHGLFVIISIQILSLFYIKDITSFAQNTLTILEGLK